ncbi:dihydrolipoamide dehydrogenase [Thermoflexales bacterium]|nr:dihydrolipoamide dehydrogenase [Thermoflexales bacterium]
MTNPAYDVVTIGGGPAGYVASIRAAQLGLKVAVVEKEFLGGVCLNVGCIPSKALLRNAEIANLLTRGKEFGFAFENLKLDYAVAHKRSRQVSDRLVKGVQFLMKKNKIEVYQGAGKLKDATHIEITAVENVPAVSGTAFTGVIESKNIIVATGARARSIPGVEVDGQAIITYRHALEITQPPKSMVIIGAGPIGLEFGYVFRSYGTEVTIIEMLPNAAPLEDEEVSKELEKHLKKLGIKLLTNTKVESLAKSGAGVEVKAGGQTFQADKALIAIGFAPNSEGLGLEAVGVKTERGAIGVDEHYRTNVPNIYAIGDVNAKLMLAHVGSAQGIVAAESIAGVETVELDIEGMPRCYYCQPQVASMGITEKQAKERGLEYKIGKFNFQPNGKALGLGENHGFVKIISEAKYGEILGVHMIGPEVTELLPEWVLARNYELTPHEVARSVHAHPTLSEAMMEAAEAVEGHSIHQ